ncbi:hypothetical protein L2E82_19883 [Cichorium intybus]|uniref:Uncharacterized protein n=1 Tax=Cichorium intybus TaxID=13427 RepID=A0ACB9DST7_CICIN|nr:hypothetical protein L2E82_19883 [Cichorium intybus]
MYGCLDFILSIICSITTDTIFSPHILSIWCIKLQRHIDTGCIEDFPNWLMEWNLRSMLKGNLGNYQILLAIYFVMPSSRAIYSLHGSLSSTKQSLYLVSFSSQTSYQYIPFSTTFPIKVSYCYPVVVMAIVTRLVTDKAVVIFSKSSCCICHSIETLICSFGANPTVYELDEHPDGQLIERELKSLGCKLCAPTVFIGQQLIGGANEIMSLHLKGKLVPMLIKERAIWL